MPESEEKRVEELVEEKTREELNEIARKEGIKSPERFPRKKAVAKEIIRAKKAKDYVKEPTGLYFSN